MSIRKYVLGACLALPLLSATAWAAPTYTWNTTGNNSGSQLQFTAGYPSELVKVRAYSINANLGSYTFQSATVGLYSGGLGVTSNGEGGPPQHAVDNVGRYDFLLFEFDTDNFKATGFEIGWKDTDSDVQVWVGGTPSAGLNLAGSNGVCGGTCTFSELTNLGFVSAGTFENVQINSQQSISTNTTGRYVLIAGRIISPDGLNDIFKISKIKGTEGTSVPEPSSMLLAGAALLGFAGFARRRRQAA
jgi:hypothetical protein